MMYWANDYNFSTQDFSEAAKFSSGKGSAGRVEGDVELLVGPV